MNRNRYLKKLCALAFLALIITGCQNCSRPDAVLKQEDPFFDVTASGKSKFPCQETKIDFGNKQTL